jgi:hypothetical protein
MHTGVGSAIRLIGACSLLAFTGAIVAPGAGAGVSIGPPGSGAAPTVAYVTQTATSQPNVWTVRADGTQRTSLGPGFSPLIAPSGQQVAASLFGASQSETGPALAIYSGVGAATLTYFDLASETAMPLAWSRDGRFLAVDVQSTAITNTARRSGLAIVDLSLKTVKVIAHGQLYGVSFAPNGSDEVVYASAPAQTLTARVNVFRSKADGTGAVALTHDGRSLYPVWGSSGIAFDRERLRHNDAPVFQIWLRAASGSHVRRLTNIRVRSLVSGLVPIAFSSDGSKLLAQFEGQDTSEAWTVLVASGRARRLTVRGRRVLQAAGISSDGKTLLMDEGGFEGPASAGRVATLPFAGGRSKPLVAHGSQASWNG